MTARRDFPGDVEVVIVAHNNLATLKDTLQWVEDASGNTTHYSYDAVRTHLLTWMGASMTFSSTVMWGQRL